MAGGALLRLLHVPAALLLGPMGAGIAVAAWHGTIAVPRWLYLMAQGVLGGMIASRFTPSIAGSMVHAWKLYLLVTLGVLGASSALGWALARWGVLPGTTAIWGSSPGAATSMVVMAEEFGADARLVAFMQYLRVVLVAVIASAVAHFVVPPAALPAAPPFFGAIDGAHFAATLALVVGGAALGHRLRMPAGALLVPFLGGSVLNLGGWFSPELPPWLLAGSYALIGWTVGLRFTRQILVYVARAFPRVLVSILALIGACGLMAVALTRFAGIDPLTAYLATSPGGADSAAIIAASSGKADTLFVMTLQMIRAITVLFIGPPLAKLVARQVRERRETT
jgi:membrane AbrB-like protein